MGIFGSNDGEGGTMAERIALIGILCFAFAWVPVFIVWKMFSVFREYSRSPEQEVEAGNMPVTTNPAKPNRNSMQPRKPLPPSHRSTRREMVSEQRQVGKEGLPNVTGLREPGRTAGAGVQKDYRGKRKPMPTQPVEPLMRMLPDTEDIGDGDVFKDRDNTTGGSKSKAAGSRLPDMSFIRPWGVAASEHFSGDPGPSSRRERNHKQQPEQEQAWPLPLGVSHKPSGYRHPARQGGTSGSGVLSK